MKQISLHMVCHIVSITAVQFTAEFTKSQVRPQQVESTSPRLYQNCQL